MVMASEVFQVPKQPTKAISLGFNAWIDFCVWLLVEDGLRVPPYTQHPERLGSLQLLGLSAPVWQNWLNQVVRWQNPILDWEGRYQSCSDWVEGEITKFQQIAEQMRQRPDWIEGEIDWESNRRALAGHYATYQAELEIAQHESRMVFTDEFSIETLLECYPGSEQLRQSLRSYWEQYEDDIEIERMKSLPMQAMQSQIKGALSRHLETLPSLNIYFVNYPIAVDWIVPSTAIVTSEQLHSDDTALEAFVQRAARRLSAALS